MTITVNGEICAETAATLDQLLVRLGFGDVLVATAVNGTFVPKGQRTETRLADGDAVEIVAPMQGG